MIESAVRAEGDLAAAEVVDGGWRMATEQFDEVDSTAISRPSREGHTTAHQNPRLWGVPVLHCLFSTRIANPFRLVFVFSATWGSDVRPSQG